MVNKQLLTGVIEAVALKELDFEGQAEETANAKLARVVFECGEEAVPDTDAEMPLVDGESANLAEVFPDDVQRAAPDDATCLIVDRNAKLLHRLEEHDEIFTEQDALLHERLDEVFDVAYVTRARTPHVETRTRHPPSLGLSDNRSESTEERSESIENIDGFYRGIQIEWRKVVGDRRADDFRGDEVNTRTHHLPHCDINP